MLSVEAIFMNEKKSSLVFIVGLAEALLSSCKGFAELLSNMGLRGAIYHAKSINFNELKCKRRIVEYAEPSPRVKETELLSRGWSDAV